MAVDRHPAAIGAWLLHIPSCPIYLCREVSERGERDSVGRTIRPLRQALSHLMIQPNRAGRESDWYEVSPCLLSSSRMSSMIVFSVLVRRYGSWKVVSGMLARGVLRRNSVMIS